MGFRRLITILAATAGLAASVLYPLPSSAVEIATVPAAQVQASFISATQVAPWDATRWTREFAEFRAAGISQVILNGAVFQNGAIRQAYYPTSLAGTSPAAGAAGAPADVIGPLLAGARSYGIKVWLGTYQPDPSWYAPTAQNVATLTASNAAATASVLADLDKHYASYADDIAGWYLSSEVSASFPWSATTANALIPYYKTLVSAAHRAVTTHRTMISPYYNVDALPDTSKWTNMWAAILGSASIDVLALQDGAGDEVWRSQAVIDQLIATKFAATRLAIARAGGRTALWGNLDLYDAFGLFKPVGDVAADRVAASRYATAFTSWSFTAQYSSWTLGTNAYSKPFGLWNTSRILLGGAPSTPVLQTASSAAGRYTYTWRASVPAAGKPLAYYRIFAPQGTGIADDFAPSWSGATACVLVQAVDTSGAVSGVMRTCP